MNKDLIGISGKAGSGKNTVASFLQDIDSSFEQKAFAAKLKKIASILTGEPIQNFEDQEFKKEFLGDEWSTYVEAMPFADLTKTNMELRMTVREFMQKLGTDGLRENLHPNVWVNALFADWRGPKMDEYHPSKWIITDVRFPNEYEAIKDRGGIILRVERTGLELMDHSSETLLDNHHFDYIIYNDGSIPDLFSQVLTFYEKIIM